MFDIAPTELLLCALVALVVIGPKDLPKAMRVVGHWVGRARGMARQFRSGFDAMVREAELEEMEKKWAAENERIMREHPPEPAAPITTPAATQAGTPVQAETTVADASIDPILPGADDVVPPVNEPVVTPPPPPPPAERPETSGQLDLGLGGASVDSKP
ncbi:MAG: twin-arginine translocase subunit TatB [Rhodospirillaceae bacterium]|nr:twin-arginine translocase subunit TatB [Rhodospirillaceae bacterium]